MVQKELVRQYII